LATDSEAPSDGSSGTNRPNTREIWFGGRLDSGWLRPRRREEPDGGDI